LIPTIEAIKAKKDIALANKVPKIQQKMYRFG
jgi:1-deoxy-D-xylulose 5-phosphate reductoisomerase